MKNFNRKWFTLIEMLIVVVIIGILAAALIPRLTSVKDKANDSGRKANLQQLVTAMSTYALDNGLTGLPATGDTALSWGAIAAKLVLGGMKSIPVDPSNGSTSVLGINATGYAYFTVTKNSVTSWGFIFASRAETPGAANYVSCSGVPFTTATDIDTVKLCDKVTLDSSKTCDVPTCIAKNASEMAIIMKY